MWKLMIGKSAEKTEKLIIHTQFPPIHYEKINVPIPIWQADFKSHQFYTKNTL